MWQHITVKKKVLSASLNKTFPSFQVMMVDVNSAENLFFDFSSWVGRVGDGTIDLPVMKPGQPFPPRE